MNLQEFVSKWHKAPELILQDLSFSVLPRSCPSSSSRPIADAELKLDCRLRADYAYPVIEESIRSTGIGDRSIESVLGQLLSDLDRVLGGHVDQQRMRRWRRPSDKPILAVILGAGFSAGFGLPITREIKRLIVEPCSSPDFSLFDQLPALYEEASNEYPLREFIRDGGDIPNFEQLLTLWPGVREQIRAYDERWANKHDQHYRGVIERFCCHLYAKSSGVTGGVHGDRFRSTVSWLASAAKKYDVRFLNFNYDLIIEQIVRAAGLQFEYLDERQDGTWGVVPIRKVHGSINWQRFNGVCSSSNAQMDLLYRSNACCIYAFPEIDRCPYGASGQIPVIIPPSADKQYEEILQSTWTFAARDIESADRVAIIGYSFPRIDAFARNALSKLLSAKVKKGNNVVVVCRSPDTADIARLLQLPDTNVLDSTWEIEHLERITEIAT